MGSALIALQSLDRLRPHGREEQNLFDQLKRHRSNAVLTLAWSWHCLPPWRSLRRRSPRSAILPSRWAASQRRRCLSVSPAPSPVRASTKLACAR